MALVPATGGVFTVDLTHSSSPVHPTEETPAVGSPQSIVSTTRLWDRKVQGGFPGTYDRSAHYLGKVLQRPLFIFYFARNSLILLSKFGNSRVSQATFASSLKPRSS